MATIEKQPSGRWRVRVRRGSVSTSKTFALKSQAQAWAAEQELNFEGGAGLPRKTVKDAFDRYATEVSPKHKGERWERVRLDRIGRELGQDKQLSEIDEPTLAAWRDLRLKSVKPASVAREMQLLGAVFEVARREWHWIAANPIKDVSKPQKPEHRTRRISDAEIEALKLAMGYHEGKPDSLVQQVCIAFLLGIETAMRQGEMLGLTRDRVDFDKRTAYLPRTKNNSARTVPLSSRAVALLQQLPVQDDGRLFAVSSASCDALFRKAKAKAMIADLRFHDTRREGTSRLAKKVDVLTLARITGHKDLRMLLVYYQEDMSSVAERLY